MRNLGLSAVSITILVAIVSPIALSVASAFETLIGVI